MRRYYYSYPPYSDPSFGGQVVKREGWYLETNGGRWVHRSILKRVSDNAIIRYFYDEMFIYVRHGPDGSVILRALSGVPVMLTPNGVHIYNPNVNQWVRTSDGAFQP